MKTSTRIAFIFGALATSALSFSTDLSLNLSQYYTSYGYQNVYQTGGTIDVNKSQSNAFGSASTVGTISAGVIKLKAESSLKQGANPLYNYAGQYVSGSFSDEVTATGGADGSSGKLFPIINLSGLVTSASSAMASVYDLPNAAYTVSVTLARFPNRQSASVSGSSTGGVFTGDALPVDLKPEFDIVYGDTYTLTVSLSVSTTSRMDSSGNAGWWSSASSDLSHTVQWGGATAKDSNGNVVNNFALNGSGGTNWANAAPVPEPSSMVALGLGGLALLRRRRNRA